MEIDLFGTSYVQLDIMRKNLETYVNQNADNVLRERGKGGERVSPSIKRKFFDDHQKLR